MQTLPRGQFPRVIDNTMRTLFVACPTKFNYRICHGLVSGERSIHLHAGAAFAKGLEVFRSHYWGTTPDKDAALIEGFRALCCAYGYDPEIEQSESWQKSAKSFDRIATAFIFYWERFAPDTDRVQPLIHEGRPAVEFNFSCPLDIYHPETGEPILYTGRFDMLGTFMNALWCVDEKTTSQLGASWGKQWELRSQFTGYAWGAQQFNLPAAGTLIRGVSVQKTDIKFGESIVYQPQWKIDRWYDQLLRDIRRMIQCWNENIWDVNLSDSCASFSGCQYSPLCTRQDPIGWIKGNYSVEHWDPTFGHGDNKESDE